MPASNGGRSSTHGGCPTNCAPSTTRPRIAVVAIYAMHVVRRVAQWTKKGHLARPSVLNKSKTAPHYGCWRKPRWLWPSGDHWHRNASRQRNASDACVAAA